jgi:hypothetical protein
VKAKADETASGMGVWPPGIGLQGLVPNHLVLLRSKDVVVSDGKTADWIRQVCDEKVSASEPLMTRRYPFQTLPKRGAAHTSDAWMRRNHPAIAFERYADDVICHCRSQHEAHRLWEALRARFESCGLQLHPDKTHVVYCRDSNRRAMFADVKFTFLGFAFRPRMSRNSRGVIYTGFCQQ